MRSLIVAVATVLLAAPCASAQVLDPTSNLFPAQRVHDPWRVDFTSGQGGADRAAPGRLLAVPAVALEQDAGQPLHAAAVEHSHAYETRAKIHKYASIATLPLFATEVVLGQSLYNTPANTRALRTAHGIVGAGIVGLFGVNTVTGAWNLFGEGWSDREGRTLRLVHGLLMMAADVGFLATTQSGPNSGSRRRAFTFETDKVTHRNIAIASISVGTVGYLLMLFANH